MTITPYLLYEDVDAAMGFLTRAYRLRGGPATRAKRATSTTPRCASATTSSISAIPAAPTATPLGSAGRRCSSASAASPTSTRERARAAGVQITQEPTDQAYGERRFGAAGPEGHHWHFSQPIADVPPQDWGARRHPG